MKSSVIKTEDSESGPVGTTNIEDKTVVELVKSEDDIMFIAFGRIYSGTLKSGQEVYVLGPKHNPSKITDKV